MVESEVDEWLTGHKRKTALCRSCSLDRALPFLLPLSCSTKERGPKVVLQGVCAGKTEYRGEVSAIASRKRHVRPLLSLNKRKIPTFYGSAEVTLESPDLDGSEQGRVSGIRVESGDDGRLSCDLNFEVADRHKSDPGAMASASTAICNCVVDESAGEAVSNIQL